MMDPNNIPFYIQTTLRPKPDPKDFTTYIGNNKMEYYANGERYFINGVSVPSFAYICNYCGTLPKNAELNAAIHNAVYDRRFGGKKDCTDSIDLYADLFIDCVERVSEKYQFEYIDYQIPVIYFRYDRPVAAGCANMVFRTKAFSDEDKPAAALCLGYADISETLEFDKLKYYLNFFARAYRQSYKQEIERIGAIMPNYSRRYVDIPRDDVYSASVLETFLNYSGLRGAVDDGN